MLDLGWSEILLIVVIALLVLGPKELSRAAFMIGNFFSAARSAFGDIRNAFEDMSEQLESTPDDASKNKIETKLKKNE